MSRKTAIFILMTIGSFAGAYLPALFGADGFSMTSLVTSTVGGFLGIWLGLKYF